MDIRIEPGAFGYLNFPFVLQNAGRSDQIMILNAAEQRMNEARRKLQKQMTAALVFFYGVH